MQAALYPGEQEVADRHEAYRLEDEEDARLFINISL